MAEKKRLFKVALMMSLMLALVIFTAGCGAGPIVADGDFLETEYGWTIEEDGSYTYALVLNNTSEDMVVSSCEVSVEGLDADGNEMDKASGFTGTRAMVGTIMPGEKSAVVIGRDWSVDPMSREWEETPAAFNFTVGGIKLFSQGDASNKTPTIHIASAEQIYSGDDYVEYEVVFENNGEEDIDVDFTGAGDFCFNVTAVFRDGEGNITGGSYGSLNMDEDVITFPAGEKVVLSVGFTSIPKGEPELILTWG